MNSTGSLLERAKHIVVEGPIGAGKTTLAKRLAEHFSAHLVLEAPETNPFLTRYYQEGERWTLATQLSFLLRRSELARLPVYQGDERVISDFMLEKDPLFAGLVLQEDEMRLYEQIRQRVAPPPPQPDLVIYLEAPPAVLIDRIRKRGVDAEMRLSEAYLNRVFQSYTRFFYDYNRAPIFIVNTGELNPVANDEDFALLLNRLKTMRGYREFFSFAG